MVWSHNDNWMVTGDHAGYVKYWQSNMNNVRMFQAHKEPVRGIRYELLIEYIHKSKSHAMLTRCSLFRFESTALVQLIISLPRAVMMAR